MSRNKIRQSASAAAIVLAAGVMLGSAAVSAAATVTPTAAALPNPPAAIRAAGTSATPQVLVAGIRPGVATANSLVAVPKPSAVTLWLVDATNPHDRPDRTGEPRTGKQPPWTREPRPDGNGWTVCRLKARWC